MESFFIVLGTEQTKTCYLKFQVKLLIFQSHRTQNMKRNTNQNNRKIIKMRINKT